MTAKRHSKGRLIIDDEGITIEGRHAKLLGTQWRIGLTLMMMSGTFTLGGCYLGVYSDLSSCGVCHLNTREYFDSLEQGIKVCI